MKLFFTFFLSCLFSLSIHAKTEKNKTIRITDSHGKWAFKEPPKRIAVINWTLTEQLLELGVTPVAIADIEGFKKASPQTKFPSASTKVIDLKSRFSPNLTKLKESNPDLIIIGYSQRDLMRPLSNIASVMYFNNFSRRFNNAKKADERFLVLAKLFNKTSFAIEKLNNRDTQIIDIKESLANIFENTFPILNIATIGKRDAWVFLENSIPFSVANRLGFRSELSEKPTKLGTHKVPFNEFKTLEGCSLLINNSAKPPTNLSNKICSHTLNTTNTYGGAMSQLYLADEILEAFKGKLK
jgi:iron complex transport system substrate-binding protein